MKINTNCRVGSLPHQINLIETLPKNLQRVAKFIEIQESDKELAHVRFAQDTIVNWAPKAIVSRGLVDFVDMSFLEFPESLQVYYGPKLLGENLFRKIYSKNLDAGLKKSVSTPAEKLLRDKNPDTKILMPVKAAIAISALVIPLAEFSLNFIKNIFTLKVFKQADFNNIANLNKEKKETQEKQEQVKESAKKHIKLAGGLFAGCLALSALLLTRGKNSKVLTSISEAVLAPGNKIFKNDAKKAAAFNKYFSLDFADNNGKLGLSRGQLTACVIAGFFGYTGAAKDRGKQNLLEVLFRYPIVGFYVVTGSEMLEKGFKSILKKKEKYNDIIGKDLEVPKLSELGDLAKTLAEKNKTSVEQEFKRLFKQKSTIVLIPLLFSIGFMGFFVAGVSRFFTQYRYDKEMENKK